MSAHTDTHIHADTHADTHSLVKSETEAGILEIFPY